VTTAGTRFSAITRTAAQTRVLDAALDLISEHGVSGTSLQMIADSMGVTKAAVYRQFKSKDDIVIALTERDAGRLGIRPVRNDYTAQVRTANGMVKAAPVTLNSVDIGGLVVRDVQALVVPGDALGENLLGLSYLTRLKRFEYSNNRLLLEN
jgi:clan AA aspartic protease (TIGR02281 family)